MNNNKETSQTTPEKTIPVEEESKPIEINYSQMVAETEQRLNEERIANMPKNRQQYRRWKKLVQASRVSAKHLVNEKYRKLNRKTKLRNRPG